MTGRMPEEGVNPVDFPGVLYDIWHWFLRLNAKRGGGMEGPAPILESEIRAFFKNRRITPQTWQLDALQVLDSIARES